MDIRPRGDEFMMFLFFWLQNNKNKVYVKSFEESLLHSKTVFSILSLAHFCGCRIMAITTAFQAVDTGSIPVTRSKYLWLI